MCGSPMPSPDPAGKICSATPIARRYSLGGERAISIRRDGRMKIVPLTELAADEIEHLPGELTNV
jgi:hypothetical protein